MKENLNHLKENLNHLKENLNYSKENLSQLMEKPNLDVVIIATIRPKILEITLNSFSDKLLKQFNVRAIINVDPIGEQGFTQQDIVTLCQQYFPNVIANTPDKGSFSEAVKWCWQQVKTDLFFHLEDDWCLKRAVDAKYLLDEFNDEQVVSVRLNLTRNQKFPQDENGKIYCTGLGLNPSIFRTNYIKNLLEFFDTHKDPEKQFYQHQNLEQFPNPKYLLYGKTNDSALVIDTGTKWRKSIGLNKWDKKKDQEFSWHLAGNTPKSIIYNLKYQFYLRFWTYRYCQELKFGK